MEGVVASNLYVAVLLSKHMPDGATISWRIDDQSVHYQPMPEIHSPFLSALDKLSPEALRRAKRVRLQWAASTGTVLFYEFDVAGADKVISQITCGKSRAK
jgi:hypothetical protein